jgi:hypothetical protein
MSLIDARLTSRLDLRISDGNFPTAGNDGNELPQGASHNGWSLRADATCG